MNYRIANFEIDTSLFKITNKGKEVAVEPKVFDLIVYLINQRHRVISRDELFAEIWAGRDVSDTTLSNHVKSARKLFGDTGELQKVIATVRGRGYQFIAAVEEFTDYNKPIDKHVKSKPSRLVKFSIPFLLLTIVAFVFVYLWRPVQLEEKPNAHPYVLVLPFTVSSDEPEKWQPFAEQMTREVIRKLRRLPGLQVVPPASAFALQGHPTLAEIQQKIPDIDYVLEAAVNVNTGQRIRVSADMINSDNGELVWDQVIDGKVNQQNFFSLQSDIAQGVVDSLKLIVGEHDKRALRVFPTSNLKAYELFVAGQQQLSQVSNQSLNQAVSLFTRAILLDPEFDLAYVARANAQRLIMSYFQKPADVLPKVISSVQAALEKNPDSAEALSSLGLAYVFAWRWQDAWKVLNAAKRLNPRLAQTELGFAIYYAGLGEIEGVHRSLARADKLDPLNTELADWGHWALVMVGELDAADEWARAKIKLHPDIGVLHSGASVTASLRGEHQRAIYLAKKGLELESNYPFALLALAQALGSAGQLEEVPELILKAKSLNAYTCPYETAVNYILLNDYDQAFSLFNDAVSSRSNCLVFTRYDLRLSAIRQDPRYNDLLMRIGLDDTSISRYSK